MLLVSSDYPGERVEVSDSCAHCTDRIRATIDRVAVVDVEPPETLVFRGGG